MLRKIMRKYLIGFTLGVLGSCCIFYPLLKVEQSNKFEFGKAQGFTDGLLYSAESLGKHFKKPESDYEVVYSVKTTDIVVYSKNGVKTIGIYE